MLKRQCDELATKVNNSVAYYVFMDLPAALFRLRLKTTRRLFYTKTNLYWRFRLCC